MDTENVDTDILTNIKRCSPQKRHIVTMMAFLGMANAFCMKQNLSVAIIAMVNQTKVISLNDSYKISECPGLLNASESTKIFNKGDVYNWNPAEQGLILSALLYGYAIAKFPGGYMARKFGAVRLFGICNMLASILTLLTPLALQWGLVPFLLARFLVGLSEGPLHSTAIAVVSKWSPKMERSRMTTIIFGGSSVGNVISFAISGVLSSSSFLGGWPSTFYCFGALGCIWYVFWIWLVYETPHDHPSISKEELHNFHDHSQGSRKNMKVPWKSIMLSLPFWAIVFSAIGNLFGTNVILTEIPTYLSTILHFNIRMSGFLSALPNITLLIGSWIAAYAADKVRSSNRFEITTIRKVMNAVAGYGPTICLLFIAFSGCRAVLIVIMLCLGLFLNGFKYAGFMTSIVDMSPEFAGILHGLATGVGTVIASTAPTIAGALLAKGASISSWSQVFFITAGIFFITTTFYTIFGTSELQSWSTHEKNITQENGRIFSIELSQKGAEKTYETEKE